MVLGTRRQQDRLVVVSTISISIQCHSENENKTLTKMNSALASLTNCVLVSGVTSCRSIKVCPSSTASYKKNNNHFSILKQNEKTKKKRPYIWSKKTGNILLQPSDCICSIKTMLVFFTNTIYIRAKRNIIICFFFNKKTQ